MRKTTEAEYLILGSPEVEAYRKAIEQGQVPHKIFLMANIYSLYVEVYWNGIRIAVLNI
jgi:hypothetical protein